MRGLLAVIGLTIGGVLFASDSVGDDQYEIRLNMSVNQPSETQQAWLRKKSGWDNWNQTTSGWMTIMSERTGLPHRAWGAGIDFDGVDVETKHLNFVETVLPFTFITPFKTDFLTLLFEGNSSNNPLQYASTRIEECNVFTICDFSLYIFKEL